MKNLLIVILIAVSGAQLSAAALIEVDIELEEKFYVPGENITAKLVILNRSGRDFVTGHFPGWLYLYVKNQSGGELKSNRPITLVYRFVVPHNKQVKRTINLGDFFDFEETGAFSIQPVVRMGPGGEWQPGHRRLFDIVTPATVDEQAFRVSLPDGRFQTGVYTIQRLTRTSHQIFAKVSNRDNGELIDVVNLGTIASFSREVDMKLNRLGYLHTLHPSGAQTFKHHIISPTGKLVARETYRRAGKPLLVPNEENRIQVKGAIPRKAKDDIPILRAIDPPKLVSDK